MTASHDYLNLSLKIGLYWRSVHLSPTNRAELSCSSTRNKDASDNVRKNHITYEKKIRKRKSGCKGHLRLEVGKTKEIAKTISNDIGERAVVQLVAADQALEDSSNKEGGKSLWM